MKTKNSIEPPFRFEAHDQQNMTGAISVDQFSPVFQRFDFTYVRLCLCYCSSGLCSTVIQTAGVGLSLSQDNAFSGSVDQCEIREVDVCVCVFTDWAKTPSVTQSRTRAWHYVSLVNTDDS